MASRGKSNFNRSSTQSKSSSSGGRSSNKGTTPQEKHELDIQKTLAERQEWMRREQELTGCPSESNDSMTIPIFCSDYSFTMESSQDTSQKDARTKPDRFATLKVFETNQVFRLFTQDVVNFSWLDKRREDPNFPKVGDSSTLIDYILSEFRSSLFRRSEITFILSCRYLFYMMSVTAHRNMMDDCAQILKEQMSNQAVPFAIQVPDLVAVLLNYGSIQSKLWPKAKKIYLPAQFKNSSLDHFDVRMDHTAAPFPYQNLEQVLRLLLFNMETYPNFSENEKIGLFHLMLNLLMDSVVSGRKNLMLVIKSIIVAILASFTEEEWREFDYKRVEELALVSFHEELDTVGMVRRIQMIPMRTERSIQVRRCCAFYAVQNFMDVDDIHVNGLVKLDDVISILENMKHPSDYGVAYCIITLVTICVDLSVSSENPERVKYLCHLVNEWRHTIRDMSSDLDVNRILAKDLMLEVALMWTDSVTKTGVV